MPNSRDVGRVVMDVAFFAASQVALYYALRYVLSSLAEPGGATKKAKAKGESLLSQTGLSKEQLAALDLDEYETSIAAEIIPPNALETTFESIGGLDEIISSLRETVIYPLTFPELFASGGGLLSAPRGVLLYGHPGCGKTMLAKALAKESGATFINLPLSSLTSKWFGESNKLVNGLFSLARKVQPSIIFIDEIDSLFRERSAADHEVTGMLKAEFMTLWDGLTSGSDRILVLGATNRPNDIDPAILRRMPKRFAIRLPNYEQRVKILTLMLSHTKTAPGFTIEALARKTDGLSGSDLKETCRNAAMVPVREFMREKGKAGKDGLEAARKEGFKVRPLTLEDFALHDSHAHNYVDPSRRAAPTAYIDPVD
ncbi:Protein MSP1 [Vanrija pseudolonga]|uniref:Protein MSP1 n=1 Tax=Vanrija pseudolonga TaxID=143232 RepID=A0AAF1BHH1_9TREE|nr:Protein MSP1 [Vanrija pseudolonga]